MTETIELLEKLNPWWAKREFESGITRKNYLDKIKKYIKSREIIVINGVRRSGKTTLIFQTIKHLLDENIDPRQILFVNFDEPDISLMKDPIKKVIESYYNEISDKNKTSYLFFDEIQNINDWERWAKTIYDEKKNILVISGSSSHLLKGNLAKLISGRYLEIEVFPLDFKEYLSFKKIDMESKIDIISKKAMILKELKEYLKEGGFPRIVIEKDKNLKNEFLKNYYESIVLKDIISNNKIRQERLIRELLYYLASNLSSLYSYKNLSKYLSADYGTIKEYLRIIENSRIFFEVSLFSYSIKAQEKNNKKIYCIDNGLINSISFKFSENAGKLAENLIALDLKKKNQEIFYWQDEKNKEIDFIIKNKDDTLTAINVTFTDEIEEKESITLKNFKEKFPKTARLIIISKDKESKGEIEIIPLWKWLLKD